MRYKLGDLYDSTSNFNLALKTDINLRYSGLLMGKTTTQLSDVISFVANAIYGYFFDDLVAYEGEDTTEVRTTFLTRLAYDISVKMPYWFKKYNQIKNLLTTEDLSLLQTSKVTSSSQDKTDSAGGSLQKMATTPTGVTTEGSADTITIEITDSSGSTSSEVETDNYVDKYTNAEQKYTNASKVLGERSGEILREGSITELLDVLEKLPSSFADEVNRELSKHFIFDYDGEERGYYDG